MPAEVKASKIRESRGRVQRVWIPEDEKRGSDKKETCKEKSDRTHTTLIQSP
jgi:hypothetical protein